MTEPDELYTLRNRFWLGAFQLAITEGSNLSRLSEAMRVERDEFVYRAYIALGQYGVVTSEIQDSAPIALQAIKLLATYKEDPEKREMVLMTLNEWLQDGASANSPSVQLVAAMIFLNEDMTKDAIKAVRHGTTMEQVSLLAQIYVKMDRTDLAQKQLRLMQQADEDATLTQLTGCWVNLALGGSKCQEALFVFEELIDKFVSTPLLLNGQACAYLHQGKHEDADRVLVDALSKAPNDPDTLANLITTYYHLDKAEGVVNRYVSQLKTVAPKHPFVAQLNTVTSCFDRVAAQYSA